MLTGPPPKFHETRDILEQRRWWRLANGVHFAESCCVVALGIGIDGVRHPLALAEGSTENASLIHPPPSRTLSSRRRAVARQLTKVGGCMASAQRVS